MLSGRVWPAHPHPLPNELLSSWLIRFARANGDKLYPFTEKTAPGLQVWTRDIDKASPLKLLIPLSYKSGRSVEQLYHTTLWPYAGRLYAKPSLRGVNRWILNTGLYPRSRRHYGLQYCPLCLTGDPPYFRRLWRLAFVTVCPKHSTLLRDRCPGCDAPVVPYRVDMGVHTDRTKPSDIPVTICYRCGEDLSAVDPSNLQVDPSVAKFQASLLKVLDVGSKTVPGQGEIDSVLYFDGVSRFLNALTGTRYTGSLSDYVAGQVGLRGLSFDLKDSPSDLEYQPLENRYALMRMAAWLLENVAGALCSRTMVGVSLPCGVTEACAVGDWWGTRTDFLRLKMVQVR